MLQAKLHPAGEAAEAKLAGVEAMTDEVQRRMEELLASVVSVASLRAEATEAHEGMQRAMASIELV